MRLVTTTTRKSGGASFASVTDEDGHSSFEVEERFGRDLGGKQHGGDLQQQGQRQHGGRPQHQQQGQQQRRRWNNHGSNGNRGNSNYGQNRNNHNNNRGGGGGGGGWGNNNQRHHGGRRNNNNNQHNQQRRKKSGFLAESKDVPRIKWESFDDTPFNPSLVRAMEQNGFEKVGGG